MKKIILTAVCAIMTIANCVAQTSELRKVEDFNTVDVKGNIDVVIVNQKFDNIMVQADENVIGHVLVKCVNNILFIGFDSDYQVNGTEKVVVTIPNDEQISSIYATDGGSVYSKKTFVSSQLVMNFTNGASFDGCVKSKNLQMHFSGNSTATICGETKNYTADISSDSHVDMHSLIGRAETKATKANIEMANL